MVKLKAKVITRGEEYIEFGFGRTDACFDIATKGKIAKKLKLKEGDQVVITVEKVA